MVWITMHAPGRGTTAGSVYHVRGVVLRGLREPFAGTISIPWEPAKEAFREGNLRANGWATTPPTDTSNGRFRLTASTD